MGMLKETQAQSNTNFNKELNYNTLPWYFVKFLPRRFDSNIMFKLTPHWDHPPISTTNIFFGTVWYRDSHDELEA